ncbi:MULTISPECIES: hypothetical protein [Nocardia]|uniref:PKD domain-containing protein n=1 Tax=Nocardia vinacea TaxID=96468 RepID=A0ABZ1YP84_9NOCA|nr:hypothetical protein [Nocardia vinacea]
MPANPLATAFEFTLYAADGTTSKGALSGTWDAASKTFTLGDGNAAEVLSAIAVGAKVRIDNRWYLALPTYSRHQVPARSGYYAFDQYRGPNGNPIYPQRATEVGPSISKSVSGGGTHTGKVNGKVIMVCGLLDSDAFSWDGDWYSRQAKAALGNKYDDTFRLWYNDNADHIAPARTDRLIDYRGVLHQALRDVAAWAERGKAPAQSTHYDVTDSQISVPDHAAQRRGIQPVVDLEVNGRDRVEVSPGTTVTFKAKIELPPGTGEVVAAAWNFTGTGDVAPAALSGADRQSGVVTQTFTYDKPGTHFPSVLATAQRDGDPNDEFTKIDNLGRVCVVVR